MDRHTKTHCFQIFSYILVSIVFTDGQYESLNLGKKLKTHEVEYGTLLSSIETGPREQLTSKVAQQDSVIIAFAPSNEDKTNGGQEEPGKEISDPLFPTKCTTDKTIVVDPSNLPYDDSSDFTADPNETDVTEDPTKPSDDIDSPTENPSDNTEDSNDNDIDPTATDETEPTTTKVYDGPKKTHVPDHYLDDV